MLVEPEPGASPVPTLAPGCSEKHTPQVQSGPPQWARPSFTGGFPGSAFPPQPDGTLRCPADRPLSPQERRIERDGSLRILYAARIGHCRSCPWRAHCQESRSSVKPRRVSAVSWPLESALSEASPSLDNMPPPPPLAPVLWKDWPRHRIRRAWLKLVRSETVVLESAATPTHSPVPPEDISTRAQRADFRLRWEQRLARNARPSDAPPLFVTPSGLQLPWLTPSALLSSLRRRASDTGLVAFLKAVSTGSPFASTKINTIPCVLHSSSGSVL